MENNKERKPITTPYAPPAGYSVYMQENGYFECLGPKGFHLTGWPSSDEARFACFRHERSTPKLITNEDRIRMDI